MTTVPLAGPAADAEIPDRWASRVRITGWVIALILGALQAWAGRFSDW